MAKLLPYMALAAGLLIGILAYPMVHDTLSVAVDVDHFVPVDAHVLSSQQRRHRQGPSTMKVKFEFQTPDGQMVRGDNRYTELGDSPDEVKHLIHRKGGVDHIRIWYDPSNPRRAVITHQIHIWPSLAIAGAVLFLVIAGAGGVRADRLHSRVTRARDERRKTRET